ncbi:MAG TPA: glycosyltransferase [Ramlibacter sp.]|nr:glycosyltransferase [Ramlibacter sp.]
MGIPKIIFQTWKSKTDIPANFAYWANTFRELNPAYEYRLWDDADNRAFIEAHYRWFLATYDAYPAEIYRADAVRYFFLFHFGGIYVDMDTECLRPFDALLDVADVVLGTMGTNPGFRHSLPNAVMLSAPRQEFWLLVMSLLLEPASTENTRPESVTGPVLLKGAHRLYAGRDASVTARIAGIRARLAAQDAPDATPTRIATLPGYVLFPLDWSDRIHDRMFRRPMMREGKVPDRKTVLGLFPHSITVSYWAHSWGPSVAGAGSGVRAPQATGTPD